MQQDHKNEKICNNMRMLKNGNAREYCNDEVFI
jgi:hypothetical protein